MMLQGPLEETFIKKLINGYNQESINIITGNISCYGINDGYIQVGGSGGASKNTFDLTLFN